MTLQGFFIIDVGRLGRMREVLFEPEAFMLPIRMIDTHLHIWSIDRPGHLWPPAEDGDLYRTWTVDDAFAATDVVQAAVLVQTEPTVENTYWLLETARKDPRIIAVTGWLDLQARDAAATINSLCKDPLLRAIRPMVQDLAADWFDTVDLIDGTAMLSAAGIRLEALVRPRHLSSLARFADRHSDLLVILDHCGKPDLTRPLDPEWVASIAALAQRSNVVCKLSGLLTEAGPVADNRNLKACVDTVLGAFGPTRVMWGSDWPVLTTRASYSDWTEIARQLVPRNAHGDVFSDTALRCYAPGRWRN